MRSRALLAVFLSFYLPAFVLAQDRAALDAIFLRANQLDAGDATSATRLYEQAARQGHTLSMVMLGYHLLYGNGEARDLPRAVSLFSAATKAGNLDGQFLLAMCYLEGLGTTKDPAAARENLLEPADKGNQYAQFTLGLMLQNGEGGPKREAAARRWLDRAASGDNRDLAARAARVRDTLDVKLFSPDNSTGRALTALLFVSLLGLAMGGGSGGYDYPSSPGSAPSSGPATPPPARPVPFYPSNPSKSVNGDLTDSRLRWK
jgi:hypothetical protein